MPTAKRDPRRLPLILLGIFVVWFALWAIRPKHPGDFLLEHVLTAVFLPILCLTWKRFRLSAASYLLIFAFLCLHVLGAHYTYSEVPYPAWFKTAAGWVGIDFDIQKTFGFARNHFDRLVHFCFGLLLAYPAREIFVRIARVKGFWGYYLPLDVMMSLSMLYELIEWAVAMVVAPELGNNYLGTQGDQWDAHKDMALASVGALIAMGVTAAINWRGKRDFAQEFAASLKPASALPPDEP